MTAPGNAFKVLLVDDEAYFRRFVGQLLRNRGFSQIVEAIDGNQAVELYPTVLPDFVVLDINMPHMDGLDTLRALRKINPDLPIIMLTSIADEMIVEQCVQEGAAYFIRKDVPAGQIAEELGAVLEQFVEDSKESN